MTSSVIGGESVSAASVNEEFHFKTTHPSTSIFPYDPGVSMW